MYENLDVSKLKSIFQSIKGILKNFIENNREAVSQNSTDAHGEIKNLEIDKASYEMKLKEVLKLETELSESYALLKNEIEIEKDSNRDAEKSMFRIIAEQNEIRGNLSGLNARESALNNSRERFNQELQEAGILVGVYALRYRDHVPKKDDGEPATLAEIFAEVRDVQESRFRIVEKIKIRLEDAGVSGSEEIMKEFNETSERDMFLAKELEDLIKSSESLKSLIKELDEKLTMEFKIGVEKINLQFNNFFSAMFGGGSASLTLVRAPRQARGKKSNLIEVEDLGEEMKDEEEDSKEGLEIEVNLPKKKVKGLMMLSGGERALTSIALIFAVSQVNPPPFIILDETDAALDEANSKKYGDMIAELSNYSQLILITHNRETMSRAGIIYGVTMGNDGVSRLLSIQFEEAVAVAK